MYITSDVTACAVYYCDFAFLFLSCLAISGTLVQEGLASSSGIVSLTHRVWEESTGSSYGFVCHAVRSGVGCNTFFCSLAGIPQYCSTCNA